MPAETPEPPRPGAPRYHRLTAADRTTLHALKRDGRRPAYIARALGVARSTVTRELRRNTGGNGYRDGQAEAFAQARAKAKAAKRRKFTEGMWRWAMERLAWGWSFPAIAGRAKLEGVPMVCAEALYQEYYRREKLVSQGRSDEVLPPLPKARRKRRRRGKRLPGAGRGRIPERVDIAERPASAGTRTEFGHKEADLINGAPGTGHLVTVVERMTRFTWVARVWSKEAAEVADAVIKLLKPFPEELRRTLTLDNGKENARFKRIEKALGIKVYFAKPYHSWERGTNENRNGIVRRVLPKGTSFADIPGETMRRIDALLNDRPMKCLGWRTPREALAEAMAGGEKRAPPAA